MAKLLLALVFLVSTPTIVRADETKNAKAQALAPACPRPEGAGKDIELKVPLDEPTRLGMGYAVMIALASDDSDWPRSALAAAGACELGKFKVGQVDWTLKSGSGEAGPPRWATPKSGRAMAFLALAPSIPEGYAFSLASPKPTTITLKKPMYVLVVVHENFRFITKLYDEIPPTAELISDMGGALEGNLPLIASVDPGSGALSFEIATQSDRRAILPLHLPGEGGSPARLSAPDGDLFVQAAAGAVRMDGSGFVCRAAAETFPLEDFWIANATENRRDLSCRFIGDKGWISIFVTRRTDRPSTKSVYNGYVEEVGKNNDIAGSTLAPLKAGAPPKPPFAGAWNDKKGQRQGLWLASIGDWYVETRATYWPDASNEIGKAVGEIYEDAFRFISSR